MVEPRLFIIAVLLAGSAGAALITGPVTRMRRVEALQQRRSRPVVRTTAMRMTDTVRAAVIPRDGSPPRQQRLVLATAGGLAIPFGLHALGGVVAAVWWSAPAAAVVLFLLAGQLESPTARRRRLQVIDDLPGALDLLSAATAAGLPLRSAVREVIAVTEGPLGEDLNRVITGIDLGRNDADAWRSLRDHPALGPISIDLARSVQSGTMVAATLHRHAVIARRNRRGNREARARTVGVRSVPPLMLCFVPAFLLISIVPIAASGILQALT